MCQSRRHGTRRGCQRWQLLFNILVNSSGVGAASRQRLSDVWESVCECVCVSRLYSVVCFQLLIDSFQAATGSGFQATQHRIWVEVVQHCHRIIIKTCVCMCVCVCVCAGRHKAVLIAPGQDGLPWQTKKAEPCESGGVCRQGQQPETTNEARGEREGGRNERSGGRRIRTNCEDKREHTPLFLSREPSCDGAFSAVAVKARGDRGQAISIRAMFTGQTDRGDFPHTLAVWHVGCRVSISQRYLVFMLQRRAFVTSPLLGML